MFHPLLPTFPTKLLAAMAAVMLLVTSASGARADNHIPDQDGGRVHESGGMHDGGDAVDGVNLGHWIVAALGAGFV